MRLELHSSPLHAWHSKEGSEDLWIWAGSYRNKTEKEDWKIILIITCNKLRAMSSENQQADSKAGFSGEEAKACLAFVSCRGMPGSMSKSPLLSGASW